MSSTKKPFSEMDVLVVDDEADICTMVQYALQSLGVHKVHIAGNGRDAWNIYHDSKVRFDMIVSDWIMPEISSWFPEARASAKPDRSTSVMLTSKSERDDVAAAAQNGVTGYIEHSPYRASKSTFGRSQGRPATLSPLIARCLSTDSRPNASTVKSSVTMTP